MASLGMTTHVLEGGCHCGAVRFRIVLDSLVATSCNCSMCMKKGMVNIIVGAERFELLSGDEVLSTYRFNTRTAQHCFCTICGIHPFSRPRSHPDDYDVNGRCIDGDILSRFEVCPFDGQHWEENVERLRAELLATSKT